MNATITRRTLPNGMRYCFDGAGNRICTGAAMGRPDVVPQDADTVRKMRLVRLRFTDGCYDSGGAYWGGPANLYWAYGESATEQAECFVRADFRCEAKQRVRETFPNARFYN